MARERKKLRYWSNKCSILHQYALADHSYRWKNNVTNFSCLHLFFSQTVWLALILLALQPVAQLLTMTHTMTSCIEYLTPTTNMHRLRNDLYCVGWGVKLYSLTHHKYAWMSFTLKSIFCTKKLTQLTTFNAIYTIVNRAFFLRPPCTHKHTHWKPAEA